MPRTLESNFSITILHGDFHRVTTDFFLLREKHTEVSILKTFPRFLTKHAQFQETKQKQINFITKDISTQCKYSFTRMCV